MKSKLDRLYQELAQFDKKKRDMEIEIYRELIRQEMSGRVFTKSNSEHDITGTTTGGFRILKEGEPLNSIPVRKTNVLNVIIQDEAPRNTWNQLKARWNKQSVIQSGYGPILDQTGYNAIPIKMKGKYQQCATMTMDKSVVFVYKSWAMVRDTATNTPGNFQYLINTLMEYGYELKPKPVIPPVVN